MFHVKHELVHIKNCPICNHEDFAEHIKCIDHNVSKDEFKIDYCLNCGFKFTNPRPSEESIYKYYQSDDYISHTSSKKGIFNKVYHTVRNYQFYRKKSLISKLNNKGNISLLDIGCGTGDFIAYCQKKNWSCFGVETDEKARKYAQDNNKCSVYKSIDEAINCEERYDIITMWHVLEHVYDLSNYLNKIKTLLKDGGWLILGLPNCNSYDAKKFNESWYAYDLPIHVSHFNNKDIIKLVEKHKFKSVVTKPLIFDAYYISMLSAKKSKRSILIGMATGWLSNLKARKTKEYSSHIYIIKN